MNDPETSTESERLSSRAGNRLTQPQSDRRGQSPGEARGPAIRAKALEILRREFPNPLAAPRESADPSAPENVLPPVPPAELITSEPRTPQPEFTNQPIPARMLNEFVYCPRLFYYEFVESVFVESADTLRGKALHGRVDSGKGDLPRAPKAEEPLTRGEGESAIGNRQSAIVNDVIHSRSVQMGSDRLGVTAKMDLVEVRTGMVSGGVGQTGDLFAALEVCPVDYKAGAPKAGEDGNELWDADRMQLLAVSSWAGRAST